MLKIIIISAIMLAATSQIVVAITQGKTPAQPYKVIQKVGNVEIRYYPPAIEASVSKQGEYNQMMNNGFRDLANYIFGGNEKSEKIAMTVPVKMELDSAKQAGKISFVMPEGFELGKHPQPNLKNITFLQTQGYYTASITFGGYATDKKREKYKEQLLKYLKNNGLVGLGSAQYLYYNPPMQVFNRRNEVLIQIQENTNIKADKS